MTGAVPPVVAAPAGPSDELGAPAWGLRRGLWLALLRGSQYLLLFVAGVVVARELGPELRAQYALSLALGSGVWILINLSLPEAAGRLLARREASLAQLARILYAASLVLGVLGMTVVVAIGMLARSSFLEHASTTAIVLGGLIVPLTLVQQVSVGLLTRVGAFGAYGWSCALTGLMQLALVVLLAATLALTPEHALAVAVLALAIRAIALAVAVARHTAIGAVGPGPGPGGSRGIVWRLLKIGLTLHPAYIALALTLRLDLFLVSALSDSRAVGLYSLATSLAEILFLVSWTMTESALRTQTEADEAAAARYTLWVSRQVLSVTLPAAVVVSLLAYPLIAGLYGREWIGSVVPLVILTCAAVAFALEGPIRVMMIRIAPPSTIAFAAGIGTAVNVALNLALIPVLGISGAALASVASYWLYLCLLLVAFRRATGLSVRPIFAMPGEGDVVPRIARSALSRLRSSRPT